MPELDCTLAELYALLDEHLKSLPEALTGGSPAEEYVRRKQRIQELLDQVIRAGSCAD